MNGDDERVCGPHRKRHRTCPRFPGAECGGHQACGFFPGGVETHLEEGKALTDAVVEFPGDADAFLVLGYEETAAENPQLFPGTVKFG